MSDSDVISYEFPCNEKIRTYLRLEALFHRFDWLAAQDSPVAHHCAIGALFDLTDATARSDLRNELVQGLERRRQQTESGTPRHQHLTTYKIIFSSWAKGREGCDRSAVFCADLPFFVSGVEVGVEISRIDIKAIGHRVARRDPLDIARYPVRA